MKEETRFGVYFAKRAFCEAGARTAAPAQEAGSSTAQREKRQETAMHIPTWQWNVMACVWCRDSTGRFLPVMSQKRHIATVVLV